MGNWWILYPCIWRHDSPVEAVANKIKAQISILFIERGSKFVYLAKLCNNLVFFNGIRLSALPNLHCINSPLGHLSGFYFLGEFGTGVLKASEVDECESPCRPFWRRHISHVTAKTHADAPGMRWPTSDAPGMPQLYCSGSTCPYFGHQILPAEDNVKKYEMKSQNATYMVFPWPHGAQMNGTIASIAWVAESPWPMTRALRATFWRFS